jgi:hypothetical protein
LLSNNDPAIPAEDVSARPKALSEVIDVVGSAATPMVCFKKNQLSKTIIETHIFSLL